MCCCTSHQWCPLKDENLQLVPTSLCSSLSFIRETLEMNKTQLLSFETGLIFQFRQSKDVAQGYPTKAFQIMGGRLHQMPQKGHIILGVLIFRIWWCHDNHVNLSCQAPLACLDKDGLQNRNFRKNLSRPLNLPFVVKGVNYFHVAFFFKYGCQTILFSETHWSSTIWHVHYILSLRTTACCYSSVIEQHFLQPSSKQCKLENPSTCHISPLLAWLCKQSWHEGTAHKS